MAGKVLFALLFSFFLFFSSLFLNSHLKEMASTKGSYHARSPHNLYIEETKQNTEKKKRIERQNPTLSVATTRAKVVSLVNILFLFFSYRKSNTSSTIL